MPSKAASSEDLPVPDLPVIAKDSPALISKETLVRIFWTLCSGRSGRARQAASFRILLVYASSPGMEFAIERFYFLSDSELASMVKF